ncbi:sigma-E factor negative regulatory protein [Extensimonas vulgaris]|uniref:RseA-like anti sigma(E) protein n=1 Tax=Extensimonas vulgaris TaxID=1031594 RepID=A0A369AMJ7_9BURK|nr:RseA family anti-sigma factor [Extensimonas vulgaris]RCX10285.1 RseA-like anti sigma(E) protein [Extensimonas vulgaris]TWI39883.1 anti sigma-E protein, RseA [Extensimonas vulgaris]TXD17425.1 anti-anti-sigma factor [Extensimonas vulgaris]
MADESINAVRQTELLSALADGMLEGEELAQALDLAARTEAQQTWQVYQLVGDVLRAPELAAYGRNALAERVCAQLAQQEQRPQAAAADTAQMLPAAAPARTEAANAAQFRWKWVVGLASVATVAVVGWGVFGVMHEEGTTAVQLAARPPAAPLVAVADPNGAQQPMLRDPRLDELLAAHQQYGYTPALQMPAGFLRNAAFESSGR